MVAAQGIEPCCVRISGGSYLPDWQTATAAAMPFLVWVMAPEALGAYQFVRCRAARVTSSSISVHSQTATHPHVAVITAC